MRGGLAEMHSFKNTAKRMFKSAWFVIAAGMWIQCTTAQSYVFSIYSESIKENLGYNQQELDSVSFWKDIGGNVGVISGLLYEIFSPWIILAIAAAMAFSGNLMTWLSITAKVPTPTLWLMCLYALVGSNAQTFSNTAVIVTCVKIFSRSRGTIVGLMKGCFGLSGAVLVQLYYAAYGTEQQEFPLLLAWLLPTVCLMFMFVIRPLPAVESGNQKKWLDKFSAVLLVLAAYLLGAIVFQSCLSLGRSWNIAIFGGVVAILICPIWVLLESELYECGSYSSENDALLPKPYENDSCLEQKCGELETPQEEAIQQDIGSHSPPGAVAGSNSVKLTSPHVQVSTWPQRGENFNLLQVALSLDFWLLFFISTCAMGSAVATINNMSQLGASLNYTTNEISTLVSLWSIWDFSGRFGGGYISELYLQSKGISRPLFMVITITAMGIGHVIIAVAFPGALYVGPIFVGICFGAQWSLMPSISSELFGLKNFSVVYNTIAVASPLGSYLLSVKMIAYLYDLEAEKDLSWLHISQVKHQSRSYSVSSSSSCSGVHCFRLSFFIMAGVCMAGALLSCVLFFRTRAFYRNLWLRLRISTHG